MNSESIFHKRAKELAQTNNSSMAVEEEEVSNNAPAAAPSIFKERSKQLGYKEPESDVDSGLKTAAIAGSRVAESIAGMPGDIIQLVKSLGSYLDEKLPNAKKEPNFLQKAASSLLDKVPTSDQLKGATSKLTKGYTDPETPNQELVDEISSLAGALALPLKNPSKFFNFTKELGLRLPKAFAKATGAELAKETVDKLGGGVGAQTAAEMGTLFLLSSLSQKTAKQFVNGKYQKARSSIPEGTILPTESLVKDLGSLEKDLAGVLEGPTSEKVLPKIRQLKSNLQGGTVEADKLLDAYHTVNEMLRDRGLFKELGSAEKRMLKAKFDRFKDEIRKPLTSYGQHNPVFLKEWNEANRAYSVMSEYKDLSAWLKSKDILKTHSTILAYDLITNAIKSGPIPAIVGTTKLASTSLPAAGAYQTGKVIARMIKDPSLRKHYFQVIEAASKENLSATLKSMKKLNEDLNKPSPQYQ